MKTRLTHTHTHTQALFSCVPPLHVEPEEHDVSLLHNVLLTLQPQCAVLLGPHIPVVLHVVIERHCLSPNEALLKVGVDHPSGLGGGHAGADGPSAGLLLTTCEVCAEAQSAVCGLNQVGQPPVCHSQHLQPLSSLLLGHVAQLSLHLGRHHHHLAVLLLGLLPQSLHVLVVGSLVGQVTLRHVCGKDHGLEGEQPQALDAGRLVLVEGHATGRLARLQGSHNPVECALLHLGLLLLLLGLLALLQPLHPLLNLSQVSQGQLQVDDVNIIQGVNLAGHVNDVVVLEAAHYLADGVCLADVCEELVAQALTLTGSAHQASNVNKLHSGGHQLLRLGDGAQHLETRVWHRDNALVGLNRTEWKVCGLGLAILHKRVEQSGLADVWQPDDAGL
mmetsp:Transcript_34505/g.76655  ORF Transcript_34505/g.76655 Transcript_34505/m.76655 type:complete len:390 (-) Transcript_34505:245-1414(-)